MLLETSNPTVEIIQYWARVPTPHTDPLWHRATALWAGIAAQLPDLAPAVALQQRLVRLTLDATSALADTPLLALERASILGKWQKGLPLLRNEVIPIPPRLKDILQPICTALADAGAGDSALHIGAAIAAQSIDADSLLGVSLARNQKAIRTSALHMGFSPDLVWLIGELGSAPLAYRLTAGLKASTTTATREASDVRSLQVDRREARTSVVPTFRSAGTGTAGTARSAARGRRSSKRTAASGRFGVHIARSSGRSPRTVAFIAAMPAAISSPQRRMCSSRSGGLSCADDAAATRR